MKAEEMKSVLLKMEDDTWHKQDLDAAYGLYADEFVYHHPPFPPSSKEADRAGKEAILSAFTEMRTTIQELVVEGDTAIAHWTWQASHTGAYSTLGIPATGKSVQISGCSLFHFKACKIVEEWEYADWLGLMQQLGIIPIRG